MSESRVLKITFVDFWGGFDPEDNFVLDALNSFTNAKVVKRHPDLMFYSVFGTKNLGFVGKKILVNGEIHSTRYGHPDFSIGYHEATSQSRLRLPLWAWGERADLLETSSKRRPDIPDRFCNFFYNNPDCEYRNRFFLALNERKAVDSLGSVFRSKMDKTAEFPRHSLNWRDEKIGLLRNYRFTMAFENLQYPGYSTEKIVDSYLAGSIPIYWGDPFISLDFNPASMIDVNRFNNPSEAIDFIMAIEESPEAISELRSQAPMSKEQYERFFDNTLIEFLKGCISAPKSPAAQMFQRSVRGLVCKPFQPTIRNPLAALARRFL
jgi:hypothetical protein